MNEPRRLTPEQVAEIHANTGDDTQYQYQVDEVDEDYRESGREGFLRAGAEYREQGAAFWAQQRDEYAAMIHKAQDDDRKEQRRDTMRAALALVGTVAWLAGGAYAIYAALEWLDMPTGLRISLAVALIGRYVADQVTKSMIRDIEKGK
jgi:hypothetical protein